MTGQQHHGRIALFGSGEIAEQGRAVQEALILRHARPVRVAVIETPAAHQPDVDDVTARLTAFYEEDLQHTGPTVSVVPARRRGGPGDPDDPAIAALMDEADLLFLGPGNPTYTANTLRESATLTTLRDRWAAGSTAVLASAGAMAAGRWVLPVYEILHGGDHPGWVPGLDLLSQIGLRVAVVPHFNFAGKDPAVDRTCCYIGRRRFEEEVALLPEGAVVIGIDEDTALEIDPGTDAAIVRGAGSVTVVADGQEQRFPTGSPVPMALLRGEVG